MHQSNVAEAIAVGKDPRILSFKTINLPKARRSLYELTTLDDAADTNDTTSILSAERLALIRQSLLVDLGRRTRVTILARFHPHSVGK